MKYPTDNLPSWLTPDRSMSIKNMQELISTLPYEVYTQIERDIRTDETLAYVIMSVVSAACTPVPKEMLKDERMVLAFNSMRVAQIAKIIVNYSQGVYSMDGGEQ